MKLDLHSQTTYAILQIIANLRVKGISRFFIISSRRQTTSKEYHKGTKEEQ